MTLSDIFDKYSGNETFYRREWPPYLSPCSLEWLRFLDATEEMQKIGFLILPDMIIDSKANDWELWEV